MDGFTEMVAAAREQHTAAKAAEEVLKAKPVFLAACAARDEAEQLTAAQTRALAVLDAKAADTQRWATSYQEALAAQATAAAQFAAAARPAAAAVAAQVDPDDYQTILKDLSVFKKPRFAAQNPGLLMQRERFAKMAAIFRRMPDLPPGLVADLLVGGVPAAGQADASRLMTAVRDLLKEAEAVITAQSDDFVMADELGWAAVDKIRGVNLGLDKDVDEAFQKELAAKKKAGASTATDRHSGDRRRKGREDSYPYPYPPGGSGASGAQSSGQQPYQRQAFRGGSNNSFARR